jgi:hypothetical protein
MTGITSQNGNQEKQALTDLNLGTADVSKAGAAIRQAEHKPA